MSNRDVARYLLLVLLAFAAGWFLHGKAPGVAAASSEETRAGNAGSLAFQLSGIARDTSLTIYDGATRTLYVYPAVTQGNSNVSCEFMLHLGKLGGPFSARIVSSALFCRNARQLMRFKLKRYLPDVDRCQYRARRARVRKAIALREQVSRKFAGQINSTRRRRTHPWPKT